MKLIIVESPTKARTLSKFLGSDYDVEATTGHIMDLPKSKLGVDVENDFKPLFEEVAKRKSTISLLKSKAKKASEIYIASDPDREGEAIASHVEHILRANTKNQKTKLKRISFHEITKAAVEEAIANPSEINKSLVDAQIARRVLDRLVGYKLSPVLWKKVRRGLSAGRVQTVALRLIVEKEREIEKFKPEEYWEIYAQVKQLINKQSLVKSEFGNSIKSVKTINSFTVQLIKQKVNDKKTADGIVKDLESAKYKVIDVKKKEVNKHPYPPFTTSTLTQAGARLFGWSSKKTMSVAQKLYEQGLITYHRTDSLNLNHDAVSVARNYISKEFGQNYLPEKPRFYKTHSKNAQEAHEAIRPTDVNCEPSAVSGEYGEQKLYDLIRRRFLACQMAVAVYDETVIDVSAILHTTSYILRASGQIMKFEGWRKLFQTTGQLDDLTPLPDVKKDEDLDLIKVESFQKFTLPPARYNEASLIKTLEKLGIGRPSTYAPTISVIQIRNYVEKKEGKFFPTSIGIAVCDFLVINFAETFEYQFTAGMEDDLDKVALGKLSWVKTIKDFYNPLEKKIIKVEKEAKRVKIEVEKLGKKCPDCKDGELVIRTGRFGKFISCDKFPDCKHTEKYLELTGVKCPDCKQSLAGDAGKVGDVIVKKSGKGRKFFGCSRYPDCKFASWRLPKKE